MTPLLLLYVSPDVGSLTTIHEGEGGEDAQRTLVEELSENNKVHFFKSAEVKQRMGESRSAQPLHLGIISAEGTSGGLGRRILSPFHAPITMRAAVLPTADQPLGPTEVFRHDLAADLAARLQLGADEVRVLLAGKEKGVEIGSLLEKAKFEESEQVEGAPETPTDCNQYSMCPLPGL